MGFLDNSGDIILDAVLTDTGRKRLAEGNGSFRITKYAFGDDEIDYSNYNATHASGSAYYDLEILQTPVFEAFTNNTANMKSKLVSLTNNNLLYLPVMLMNNTADTPYSINTSISSGSLLVGVDAATITQFGTDSVKDYLNGNAPSDTSAQIARVDQGLNTTEISNNFKLDAELTENQFIVEIDNRFGFLTDTGGNAATFSFIDDDNIASYYLSSTDFVSSIPAKPTSGNEDQQQNQLLAGPRGNKLEFKIGSSINLKTSTYLFTQVGNTLTDSNGTTYHYIDSVVMVMGATTGYKLDMPVRFVKKQ